MYVIIDGHKADGLSKNVWKCSNWKKRNINYYPQRYYRLLSIEPVDNWGKSLWNILSCPVNSITCHTQEFQTKRKIQQIIKTFKQQYNVVIFTTTHWTHIEIDGALIKFAINCINIFFVYPFNSCRVFIENAYFTLHLASTL